jgi:hypothetical protein
MSLKATISPKVLSSFGQTNFISRMKALSMEVEAERARMTAAKLDPAR